MIARDQAKNEGIEDIHSRDEGRNESRILLERYDMVSKMIMDKPHELAVYEILQTL